MSENMKENLTDGELSEEQLEGAAGGDGRIIDVPGGRSPPGGRGGSKTMTITCPECGSTITVTTGGFSEEITCPVCKRSFIF